MSGRLPSGAFSRYDLRTVDPEGAAEFYGAVAGLRTESEGGAATLFADERRIGALVPLPEQARTRGVPAHWLGHVFVEDPGDSVDRLVARGGQQLGPWLEDPSGPRFATVRDPQGAVFAIGSGASAALGPRAEGTSGSAKGARASGEPAGTAGDAPPVAWHELHTTDREAAWTFYSELFGWREVQVVELGPEVGPYRIFTWSGGARSVGGMSNTARAPETHTHWLFYLSVPDLDHALETARALGASVTFEPVEVPGGDRVVACDDPQGAAFALTERGA